MARRASDEELLVGALHARIERWLELEGIFTIAGFGDVELAGELDWRLWAGRGAPAPGRAPPGRPDRSAAAGVTALRPDGG